MPRALAARAPRSGSRLGCRTGRPARSGSGRRVFRERLRWRCCVPACEEVHMHVRAWMVMISRGMTLPAAPNEVLPPTRRGSVARGTAQRYTHAPPSVPRAHRRSCAALHVSGGPSCSRLRHHGLITHFPTSLHPASAWCCTHTRTHTHTHTLRACNRVQLTVIRARAACV
jgi:hypothetical protein